MPLSLDDIDPSRRGAITSQSYAAGPRIDGVKIVDLKLLGDDGGSFAELARLDDAARVLGLEGFQVRQVNFSELLPGAVKAWHIHFGQEDLWFVPPGARLLVGLQDLRSASPTCGQAMRFVLGGGRTQLLVIPRGVAHGAANPWTIPSFMFYFVNQHFSAQDTDERRLPWDAFGADFWAIQKG